jgi:hypothetical protein
MERIHYDVIRHGDGWRVQTCGFTSDCANQLEALTYAYFLAKDLWSSLRAPTCVRVRTADGGWREARVFGVEDLLG